MKVQRAHGELLEVVEGNDPKYIYGQSFGYYGDMLENRKIPNNMVLSKL